MSPSEAQMIRQILEQRMDQLSSDTQEIIALARQTNGRVTRLEKWQIAEQAKQEQRNSDKTWFQPVVTGVVTAVMVLLITLVVTGQV